MLPDKLWQSSQIDDWTKLDSIKPDCIIDLAGLDTNIPEYTQGRMLYVYWPIDDGPLPQDLMVLMEMADTVANRIREGKRVISHCAAGINRSSLMTGCILYNLGVSSGQNLVDYIKSHRPGALTNQSFANFLAGLPGTFQHTMALRREEEKSKNAGT